MRSAELRGPAVQGGVAGRVVGVGAQVGLGDPPDDGDLLPVDGDLDELVEEVGRQAAGEPALDR